MSFNSNFSKYFIENYGYIRLPEIKITDSQREKYGLSKDSTNLDFLTALTREGFKSKSHKIIKERYKEYGDRIKYEISIFDELGFVDYILLVWMVINKARELGIFIDYGRGSVAGSATCWLLGISGVDAVEKKLIFERFVSRTRAGKKIIDGQVFLKGELLADVDINIGGGIPAIDAWLKEIYPNRISRILNYSTFTTKILLKDVYKSLKEVSEFEAKEVSDMIEVHFGISQEIEEAYEKNKNFKAWCDNNNDVVAVSKKLSSLLRQTSVHASGWLCSYYELTDIIPLECAKDGEVASSYDMREVSNFVTKLDLLGLQTNQTLKNIFSKISINLDSIDLDNNPVIYNKFQNGDLLPYGLYQISADCAYGVLNQIKPKNIYELSDVNACARPGALSYVHGYTLNNHPCPHPVFEKILGRTRNYCLYQEQMMQMAVAIGFTLDEAETLRKIVGKKLVDKVKEWKEKIYDRCAKNGFEKEIGDILWKVLEDSAKYSFNLSHSLSTSYLSALTVYLKYQYPVEFYWACLCGVNELASPLDEITAIQKELQYFGIKLLPPDIIKSEFDYTIEDGNIRTGLSSLRNLSGANLDKLRSFKATATNKFELFMSCQNAKLPLGVISSLILSGAFDSFVKDSRNRLLFEYEVWNELTPREIPIINSLGPKFNYDLTAIIRACAEEIKNEKGVPLIKESRRETLRKKCQPFVLKFKANSRFEELTAYIAENHYLGFSYSHSLKSIYSKHIHDLTDLKQLSLAPAGDYKVVAQLVESEERVSKTSKKTYVKYDIKDDVESLSCLSFSLDSREAMIQNNGRMIKPNDIAVWHVTKKCKGGDGAGNHTNSIHFVQDIVIQDVPTVLKVSEIRKELEKEEKV
jgi:DNA polymerase-3 subunit alpha